VNRAAVKKATAGKAGGEERIGSHVAPAAKKAAAKKARRRPRDKERDQ